VGKLPSFQFYPGDWLKDPQLRMAASSSRGIWIDLICAMWEAPERGVIEGTPAQFCKLVGCSADEFSLFLSETKSLRFANVQELSADPQGAIRVECRRVLREEKQRREWAKQKSRQRGYTESGPKSADCPPNVREVSTDCPASPSSSPSSSKISKSELEDWYDREFLPRYPAPRREAQRLSALAELRKLKPSREKFAQIIAGVERWSRSPEWTKDGGEFALGPGKFLKGRHYERSPAVGGNTNGSGAHSPDAAEVLERARVGGAS